MTKPGPLFAIGSRQIHYGTAPYIIAEIGVNHGGSLEKARELIRIAREGGADAVKFQTYKAETLASRNSPAYWDRSKEPTASQYELFKKYDALNSKDYEKLAQYCADLKIDFLSTPFDLQAVDNLAPLMPCIKIASADITNIPLLRKVAATGKPVILSTGASTLAEIERAVNELERFGCTALALLHCILNYPTEYPHANLNMIEGLRQAFPDYIIGYSDHTLPDPAMVILTASYLKGARIIEKHFTHDKSLPGNDHYHAMDIDDLKQFRKNIITLRAAEGLTEKAPLPSEAPARENARRSIVLARSVAKGETLCAGAMVCKRPAAGISPIHWDDVVGRKAQKDMAADEILQWQALEQQE